MALLFGGRWGPLGKWSCLSRTGSEGLRRLPWAEGPATTGACRGSSWGCSCSAGTGAGELWPRPLWRAASDVPASPSPGEHAGLLEEARLELGVPSWEAVRLELEELELQVL